MKKLCVILATACLISCAKDKPEIEGIAISNKELEEYILACYDKNWDGVLSKAEALQVTEIYVQNSQEPIDGLENFPNLEWLNIRVHIE